MIVFVQGPVRASSLHSVLGSYFGIMFARLSDIIILLTPPSAPHPSSADGQCESTSATVPL